MHTHSRAPLYVRFWLLLAFLSVGQAPVQATCAPGNHVGMSEGVGACCGAAAQSCACRREPGLPAAHLKRSAAEQGRGLATSGCPCLTSAPHHESVIASETTRIRTVFAILDIALLPSLLPVASLQVRAGPLCSTLRSASACSSPPRAPPCQG